MPVGRLAVDVREPPCPNLAGWLGLAGGLSALGVSGEIPLDAALLDDRSLATVRRLQGEKLLQNSSDANSPSTPPTIRMIPLLG
jgi:hypothetical protein